MTAAAFVTLKQQVTALTPDQREELASLLNGSRQDWEKGFRLREKVQTDELADARKTSNTFDAEEWQW